MYKLDDLFDFDGDGELDSVERMEMYQFMDNTANRDRNRFFEDDDGLNLFEDRKMKRMSGMSSRMMMNRTHLKIRMKTSGMNSRMRMMMKMMTKMTMKTMKMM